MGRSFKLLDAGCGWKIDHRNFICKDLFVCFFLVRMQIISPMTLYTYMHFTCKMSSYNIINLFHGLHDHDNASYVHVVQ